MAQACHDSYMACPGVNEFLHAATVEHQPCVDGFPGETGWVFHGGVTNDLRGSGEWDLRFDQP